METKMIRAVLAVAICMAGTAKSFAAALDLAGVDRTVTDVVELASYDEGVMNSSSTLAMLTFDISTDQTFSGALGGNLKLVKSGTGTLTLSALARTYTGGTLVNSGGKLKLGAANKNILGTGPITIADGAAIDFNGCLANVGNGMPAIYATGTGTDGTGAILNTGTQFGNNGVNNLYLTGDLLIYAKNRMNFVTVYTQGHTLRYKGATQSAFTTINNSQGGDVSIESGTYTAWGSNNCLGNTPSKGKVYLRGGILNFYRGVTIANDVVVASSSRMRQGQSGSTATLTGKFDLNNSLIVDGGNPIVFKGKVFSPASPQNLQVSDNGNLPVTFNGCSVSNVNFSAYCGNITLASGTTWYSPNGMFRHLMGNTQANRTSTLTIAAGTDTTVSYFTSGNTSFSAVTTGIVNQVGGTFRTVGCYNTSAGDGIRLGHYSTAQTIWNMSGGALSVGSPYVLSLSEDGKGTFNLFSGEVTTDMLNLSRKSSATAHGIFNMTGGMLNIGANGIGRTNANSSNKDKCYEITLGGGIVRASHENGFSSELKMTLTGSSGTNVTFDTQAANVTLSGVLSGAGGLQKAGSGKLTLSGANTYAGATTVKGGTVAFTQTYPGGDLEIDAATLAGASSPIVTVASLAFSSGKGVRILNAETLDTATFGDTKSLATSTAQIAALPSLTFVASDGTTIADTGKWHYRLSPDRHTLKFGAHCGLLILVR